MKTWKKIFIGLVAVMLVSPVIADDLCQDDNYLYVVPELALCSTHAYNGGFGSNEDLRSLEDKNHMNHVIALKSTIITQQMYKQYETLDKLIKKLKTQLEKAVLTTRLEVAGAKSDNSSSGTLSSGSRLTNVKLDGASDCSDTFDTDETLKCLQDNYRIIQTASSNGSKPNKEAADQLKKDVGVVESVNARFGTNKCNAKITDCKNIETSYSSRTRFEKCLTEQKTNIGILLGCREREKADMNKIRY